MASIRAFYSLQPAVWDKAPRNTSDEQLLVVAAQSGDERSMEILIEQLTPMVTKLARRYFLPGQDREDLLQEGSIGLLYAIRSYDRRLDPSFSNHASRCVLNHLVAAVRKATRKRQRVLSGASSLDTGLDVACTHATEEVALARVGLREAAVAIHRNLTPHEQRVLTARVVGYSPQEICAQVGLSPKQVENSLYRARVKMRASTELAETA